MELKQVVVVVVVAVVFFCKVVVVGLSVDQMDAGRIPLCPSIIQNKFRNTVYLKSKKYFQNLLTQLYYDFRKQYISFQLYHPSWFSRNLSILICCVLCILVPIIAGFILHLTQVYAVLGSY